MQTAKALGTDDAVLELYCNDVNQCSGGYGFP